MKTTTLIIVGLLLIASSSQAGYLIKGPHLSSEEFHVRLAAWQRSAPFSNWSFSSAQEKSKLSGIDKDYLAAKKMQSHNPEEAILIYEKIYERRLDYDWADVERQVIAATCEFLASLEKDDLRRQRLLLEAKSFRSLKVKSGRRSTRLDRLLPRNLLKDFNFASINGERLEFSETFEMPNGQFRLTLYSDAYLSKTRTVDGSLIKNLALGRQPLVSGHCTTGFFSHPALSELPSGTKVATNECVALVDKRAPLGLQPSIETRHKDQKALISKVPRWVWWSAGAVVGILLIKNSQSEDRPTTHREDF